MLEKGCLYRHRTCHEEKSWRELSIAWTVCNCKILGKNQLSNCQDDDVEVGMQQYQDQKGKVFYLLRSLSTKMPLCTQLFPTYINTYKVVLYVKESSLNETSMEISIINPGENLMINVRVIEPAFWSRQLLCLRNS